MECQYVKAMLNSYIDGELPTEQTAQMNRHFEICQSCAREAEALRQLVRSLNTMPSLSIPEGLARKTLRKVRREFRYPSILEWWQNLTFSIRSVTCSAVALGLLLGVGLGISLTHFQTSIETNGLINVLYFTGGILP